MPVFTLPLVKLLNVRLGPEDARLAAELRREGELDRLSREPLVLCAPVLTPEARSGA